MKEVQQLHKLIKTYQIDKHDIANWIITRGYSIHNFNEKYKNKYKSTPIQYWNKRRLRKAIKIYRKTWSVNQVSQICGYNNNNEFYIEYKRIHKKPWNSKKQKLIIVSKKIILIFLAFFCLRLFYLNTGLCQDVNYQIDNPGIFTNSNTKINFSRTCHNSK